MSEQGSSLLLTGTLERMQSALQTLIWFPSDSCWHLAPVVTTQNNDTVTLTRRATQPWLDPASATLHLQASGNPVVAFKLEPELSQEKFIADVACKMCTTELPQSLRGLIGGNGSSLAEINLALQQITVNCSIIYPLETNIPDIGAGTFLVVSLVPAASLHSAATAFEIPVVCEAEADHFAVEGDLSQSVVAGAMAYFHNLTLVHTGPVTIANFALDVSVTNPCFLSLVGQQGNESQYGISGQLSDLNVNLRKIAVTAGLGFAGQCVVNITAGIGGYARSTARTVTMLKYNAAPLIEVLIQNNTNSGPGSGKLQIAIEDTDCTMGAEDLGRGSDFNKVSVRLDLTNGHMNFPVYMHWAQVQIDSTPFMFVARLQGPLPSVNAVLRQVQYTVEAPGVLRILVQDSSLQGANGQQSIWKEAVLTGGLTFTEGGFHLPNLVIGQEDVDTPVYNISWPGSATDKMVLSIQSTCSIIVPMSQLLIASSSVPVTLTQIGGISAWSLTSSGNISGSVATFRAFLPELLIRCPANFYGETSATVSLLVAGKPSRRTISISLSPRRDPLRVKWASERLTISALNLKTAAEIEDLDTLETIWLQPMQVRVTPEAVAVCVQHFHNIKFPRGGRIVNIEGIHMICSAQSSVLEIEGSQERIAESLRNIFVQRSHTGGATASIDISARYSTMDPWGSAVVRCDVLPIDPVLEILGYDCEHPDGCHASPTDPFFLPPGMIRGSSQQLLNLSVVVTPANFSACGPSQIRHGFIENTTMKNGSQLTLQVTPVGSTSALAGFSFMLPSCQGSLWEIVIHAKYIESYTHLEFEASKTVIVSSVATTIAQNLEHDLQLGTGSPTRLRLTSALDRVNIPALQISAAENLSNGDLVSLESSCCTLKASSDVFFSVNQLDNSCMYSAPAAMLVQGGSISGLSLERPTGNLTAESHVNISLQFVNSRSPAETTGVDITWTAPAEISPESYHWAQLTHVVAIDQPIPIAARLQGDSQGYVSAFRLQVSENCTFVLPQSGIRATTMSASGSVQEINRQLELLEMFLRQGQCNLNVVVETEQSSRFRKLTARFTQQLLPSQATVKWSTGSFAQSTSQFIMPNVTIHKPENSHVILNLAVSHGVLQNEQVQTALLWHQVSDQQICFFGDVDSLQTASAGVTWMLHGNSLEVVHYAYAQVQEPESASKWKRSCARALISDQPAALSSGFVQANEDNDILSVARLVRFNDGQGSIDVEPQIESMCGSALAANRERSIILSRCLSFMLGEGNSWLLVSIKQGIEAFELKQEHFPSPAYSLRLPISGSNSSLSSSLVQVRRTLSPPAAAVLEVSIENATGGVSARAEFKLFDDTAGQPVQLSSRNVELTVGVFKTVCVPATAHISALNSTRAVVASTNCGEALEAPPCSQQERAICFKAEYDGVWFLPFSLSSATGGLDVHAQHDFGSIKLATAAEPQELASFFLTGSGLAAFRIPALEIEMFSAEESRALALAKLPLMLQFRVRSDSGTTVYEPSAENRILGVSSTLVNGSEVEFTVPVSQADELLKSLAYIPETTASGQVVSIAVSAHISPFSTQKSSVKWNTVTIQLPLPETAGLHLISKNPHGLPVFSFSRGWQPLGSLFELQGEPLNTTLKIDCLSCTFAVRQDDLYEPRPNLQWSGPLPQVQRQLLSWYMTCDGQISLLTAASDHQTGSTGQCVVVAELRTSTIRQVLKLLGVSTPLNTSLSFQVASMDAVSGQLALLPHLIGVDHEHIKVRVAIEEESVQNCSAPALRTRQPMCPSSVLSSSFERYSISLSGAAREIVRCLAAIDISECAISSISNVSVYSETPGLSTWPARLPIVQTLVSASRKLSVSLNYTRHQPRSFCIAQNYSSSTVLSECTDVAVQIGNLTKISIPILFKGAVGFSCHNCVLGMSDFLCRDIALHRSTRELWLTGQAGALQKCSNSVTVSSMPAETPARTDPVTFIRVQLREVLMGPTISEYETHIAWSTPRILPALIAVQTDPSRDFTLDPIALTPSTAFETSGNTRMTIHMLTAHEKYIPLANFFQLMPIHPDLQFETVSLTLTSSCPGLGSQQANKTLFNGIVALSNVDSILRTTSLDTATVPDARLGPLTMGVSHNVRQKAASDSVHFIKMPRVLQSGSLRFRLRVSNDSRLVLSCSDGKSFEAIISTQNSTIVTNLLGRCVDESVIGGVVGWNADNAWIVTVSSQTLALKNITATSCFGSDKCIRSSTFYESEDNGEPFWLCVSGKCSARIHQPASAEVLQAALLSVGSFAEVSKQDPSSGDTHKTFMITFNLNGNRAHVGMQNITVQGAEQQHDPLRIPAVGLVQAKLLLSCIVTGELSALTSTDPIRPQVAVVKHAAAPSVYIWGQFTTTKTSSSSEFDLRNLFEIASPERVATYESSSMRLSCQHKSVKLSVNNPRYRLLESHSGVLILHGRLADLKSALMQLRGLVIDGAHTVRPLQTMCHASIAHDLNAFFTDSTSTMLRLVTSVKVAQDKVQPKSVHTNTSCTRGKPVEFHNVHLDEQSQLSKWIILTSTSSVVPVSTRPSTLPRWLRIDPKTLAFSLSSNKQMGQTPLPAFSVLQPGNFLSWNISGCETTKLQSNCQLLAQEMQVCQPKAPDMTLELFSPKSIQLDSSDPIIEVVLKLFYSGFKVSAPRSSQRALVQITASTSGNWTLGTGTSNVLLQSRNMADVELLINQPQISLRVYFEPGVLSTAHITFNATALLGTSLAASNSTESLIFVQERPVMWHIVHAHMIADDVRGRLLHEGTAGLLSDKNTLIGTGIVRRNGMPVLKPEASFLQIPASWPEKKHLCLFQLGGELQPARTQHDTYRVELRSEGGWLEASPNAQKLFVSFNQSQLFTSKQDHRGPGPQESTIAFQTSLGRLNLLLSQNLTCPFNFYPSRKATLRRIFLKATHMSTKTVSLTSLYLPEENKHPVLRLELNSSTLGTGLTPNQRTATFTTDSLERHFQPFSSLLVDASSRVIAVKSCVFADMGSLETVGQQGMLQGDAAVIFPLQSPFQAKTTLSQVRWRESVLGSSYQPRQILAGVTACIIPCESRLDCNRPEVQADSCPELCALEFAQSVRVNLQVVSRPPAKVPFSRNECRLLQAAENPHLGQIWCEVQLLQLAEASSASLIVRSDEPFHSIYVSGSASLGRVHVRCSDDLDAPEPNTTFTGTASPEKCSKVLHISGRAAALSSLLRDGCQLNSCIMVSSVNDTPLLSIKLSVATALGQWETDITTALSRPTALSLAWLTAPPSRIELASTVRMPPIIISTSAQTRGLNEWNLHIRSLRTTIYVLNDTCPKPSIELRDSRMWVALTYSALQACLLEIELAPRAQIAAVQLNVSTWRRNAPVASLFWEQPVENPSLGLKSDSVLGQPLQVQPFVWARLLQATNVTIQAPPSLEIRCSASTAKGVLAQQARQFAPQALNLATSQGSTISVTGNLSLCQNFFENIYILGSPGSYSDVILAIELESDSSGQAKTIVTTITSQDHLNEVGLTRCNAPPATVLEIPSLKHGAAVQFSDCRRTPSRAERQAVGVIFAPSSSTNRTFTIREAGSAVTSLDMCGTFYRGGVEVPVDSACSLVLTEVQTSFQQQLNSISWKPHRHKRRLILEFSIDLVVKARAVVKIEPQPKRSSVQWASGQEAVRCSGDDLRCKLPRIGTKTALLCSQALVALIINSTCGTVSHSFVRGAASQGAEVGAECVPSAQQISVPGSLLCQHNVDLTLNLPQVLTRKSRTVKITARALGGDSDAELALQVDYKDKIEIEVQSIINIKNAFAFSLKNRVILNWSENIQGSEVVQLYVLCRDISSSNFTGVTDWPINIDSEAGLELRSGGVHALLSEVRLEDAITVLQSAAFGIDLQTEIIASRVLVLAACLTRRKLPCATSTATLNVDIRKRGSLTSAVLEPTIAECAATASSCPSNCILDGAVSIPTGSWWLVGKQFNFSLESARSTGVNKQLELSLTTRAHFGVQQIKASQPLIAQAYAIDFVVDSSAFFASSDTVNISITSSSSEASEIVPLQLGGPVSLDEGEQRIQPSKDSSLSVECAFQSLSFVQSGLSRVSVGRVVINGPGEGQKTIRFTLRFNSTSVVVRDLTLQTKIFSTHKKVFSGLVSEIRTTPLFFHGTFSITFGGYRTTSINLNATQEELHLALALLPNVDLVQVAASVAQIGQNWEKVWRVTFLDDFVRHVPIEVGDLSARSDVTLSAEFVRFPLGVPAAYTLTSKINTKPAGLYINTADCSGAGALPGIFQLVVDTAYGEFATKPMQTSKDVWLSNVSDSESAQFGLGPAIRAVLQGIGSSDFVRLNHQFQIKQVQVEVMQEVNHSSDACHGDFMLRNSRIIVRFRLLPHWVKAVRIRHPHLVALESSFEPPVQAIIGSYILSLGGIHSSAIDASAPLAAVQAAVQSLFQQATSHQDFLVPDVLESSHSDWTGFKTFLIVLHEQPIDMVSLLVGASSFHNEASGALIDLRLITGQFHQQPQLLLSDSRAITTQPHPTTEASGGLNPYGGHPFEQAFRLVRNGNYSFAQKALFAATAKTRVGSARQLHAFFSQVYVVPPSDFSGEIRLQLEVCALPCALKSATVLRAKVSAQYARFSFDWTNEASIEDTHVQLRAPEVRLSHGIVSLASVVLTPHRGQLAMVGSATFLRDVNYSQGPKNSISFIGQIDHIPNFAKELEFRPGLNQNGLHSISVEVSQLTYGCTTLLSEKDSRTIEAAPVRFMQQPFMIKVRGVNDAPSVHLPRDLSVEEDSPLLIQGIALQDMDQNSTRLGGMFRVILIVSQGELSVTAQAGVKVLRSLTGQRQGESCETCRLLRAYGKSDSLLPGRFIEMLGSFDAIQASLTSLVFKPLRDFSGIALLYAAINDLSGSTNMVHSALTTIDVVATPDVAAVEILKHNLIALEDSGIAVPGIRILHPDTSIERTLPSDPLIRLLQQNTSSLPISNYISVLMEPPAPPLVNVSLGVNFGNILLGQEGLVTVHYGCRNDSTLCIMSGSVERLNEALRFVVLFPGKNTNSEVSWRSLQLFASATSAGPSFLEPILAAHSSNRIAVEQTFWQDGAISGQLFARITPVLRLDPYTGLPESSPARSGTPDEAIDVLSIRILPTVDAPTIVSGREVPNLLEKNRDFTGQTIIFNSAVATTEELGVPAKLRVRSVDSSEFEFNNKMQDLVTFVSCEHCKFWRRDRKRLLPFSSTARVTGLGTSSVSISGNPQMTNVVLDELVLSPVTDYNGNDSMVVSVCQTTPDGFNDLSNLRGGSNYSMHENVPVDFQASIEQMVNPLIDTINFELVDWLSVLPALPQDVLSLTSSLPANQQISQHVLELAMQYFKTIGTTRVKPATGYVFSGRTDVAEACDSQAVPIIIENTPEPPSIAINGSSIEIVEDTGFIMENWIRLIPREKANSILSISLASQDGRIELVNSDLCRRLTCAMNTTNIQITGRSSEINVVLKAGVQFLSLKNDNYLSQNNPMMHILGTDVNTQMASHRQIGFTILPSNDKPEISLDGQVCDLLPHGTCFADLHNEEDSDLPIPRLILSDVDSQYSAVLLTATLEAEQGLLQVFNTPGVFISGGSMCDSVEVPLDSFQRSLFNSNQIRNAVQKEKFACIKLHGELKSVNTALISLTFTPSPEYVGVSLISVDVEDFGDIDISSFSELPPREHKLHRQRASTAIVVNTTAVNDPPIILVQEFRLFPVEDGTYGIHGVSITDSDAGQTDDFHLTARLNSGQLLLGPAPLNFEIGMSTVPASQVSVFGELRFLNLALSKAIFFPSKDASRISSGQEPVLHFEINDLGNRPAIGAHNVTVSVDLFLHTRPSVGSIRLEPPKSMQSATTCEECTNSCAAPSFLAVCAIEDQLVAIPVTLLTSDSLDISAPSYVYELFITASLGMIRSNPFSQVRFERGSSELSSTIQAMGTFSQLAHFLENLEFVPAPHFFGLATVTLTVQQTSFVDFSDVPLVASELTVPVVVRNVNHRAVFNINGVGLTNGSTTLLLWTEDEARQVQTWHISDDDSAGPPPAEQAFVHISLNASAGLLAVDQAEIPHDVITQTANASSLKVPKQSTINRLKDSFLATSLHFTGPLDGVNIALAKVTYAPPADSNYGMDGFAYIHVQVADQLELSSNTLKIYISPEADMPTLNYKPASTNEESHCTVATCVREWPPLLMEEDTALHVSGLSISDADGVSDSEKCLVCLSFNAGDVSIRIPPSFSVHAEQLDLETCVRGAWPTVNKLLRHIFIHPMVNFEGTAALYVRLMLGTNVEIDTIDLAVVVSPVDDAPLIETRQSEDGGHRIVTPGGQVTSLQTMEIASLPRIGSSGERNQHYKLFKVLPIPPSANLRDDNALGTQFSSWQITQVRSTSPAASPQAFVGLGESLYFSAEGDNGTQLFRAKSMLKGGFMEQIKQLDSSFGGSRPRHLTSLHGTVFFSASGTYLDWILKDDCNGMNHVAASATDVPAGTAVRPGPLLFVASQSSIWNAEQPYSCPAGYYWADTEEAAQYLSAWTHAPQAPTAYSNTCGWTGIQYGGVERRRFRFADSSTTGGFIHAGRSLQNRVNLLNFDTGLFAGIVCLPVPAGFKRQLYEERAQLGRELWQYDISSDTAHLVADLEKGSAGSDPKYLMVLPSDTDSTLLFSAAVHPFGRELFITRAHVEDTKLLKDIKPGPESSNPSDFVAHTVNDTAFVIFVAESPNAGAELWKTDGTATGTVLVEDIWAGPTGSRPRNLYFSQSLGLTVFSADHPISGREVWVSNGTSASTAMLADIYPGTQSSDPDFFIDFDGLLIFVATDQDHGREIWQSDGTSSGTFLLHELVIGLGSSSPTQLSIFEDDFNKENLIFWAAATESRSSQKVPSLWVMRGGGSVRPAFQNTTLDFQPMAISEELPLQERRMIQFDGCLYLSARVGAETVGTASSPCTAATCKATERVAARITDIDSPGDSKLELEISASKGVVLINDAQASMASTRNNMNFVSVSCSMSECNKVLEDLAFRPHAGQSGHDDVLISAKTVSSSTGQVISSNIGRIPLLVLAGESLLQWSAPSTVFTRGGRQKTIQGIILTESFTLEQKDPIVVVSISPEHGVVSVSSTDGVHVVSGTGLDDRQITLAGPIDDINACIHSMLYTCSEQENCLTSNKDALADTIVLQASRRPSAAVHSGDASEFSISVNFE